MSASEYEMTSEERNDFEEDLDFLEYLATEARFDALRDLAAGVCLRRPLPPLEQIEYTENRKLIADFGVLGLRTALEIESGQELWPEYTGMDQKTIEEKLEAGFVPMQLDTPIRHRDLFHDPLNLKVIKKAEQFGKALIEESFSVLGQDAYAQVEHMNSGDVEREKQAMEWLYNRVRDMSHGGDGPEANGKYLYHPIRLSPKVIGQYPKLNIEPTCLSASIAMSSFFEKAGVPYLHAGVQMSGQEERIINTTATLLRVSEHLNEVSPILADSLKDKALRAKDSYDTDRGFHAAVYARRSDGQWQQVDPYFNGFFELHPKANEDMERAYQNLKEFEADAPSLELSMFNPTLFIETGLNSAVFDGHIKPLDTKSMEDAANILMNKTESVPQEIYDQLILPSFEKLCHEDTPADIRVMMKIVLDEDIRESLDKSILEDAFYAVFEKYVLWGESIETVRERMMRDDSYRRERLRDLSNMPEMICAALSISLAQDDPFEMNYHQKIEVGLPHARVGFAVLSDFAVDSDYSMPPGFWFAHWPSLVPVTETLGGAHHNYENQRIFKENMAKWSQNRFLTYVKSDSIVKKFLSEQDS